MRCLEVRDHRQSRWSGPGLGEKEKQRSVFNGTEFPFRKMERVLEMDVGSGCTTVGRQLMLLNCTLKIVKMVRFHGMRIVITTIISNSKKEKNPLSWLPSQEGTEGAKAGVGNEFGRLAVSGVTLCFSLFLEAVTFQSMATPRGVSGVRGTRANLRPQVETERQWPTH